MRGLINVLKALFSKSSNRLYIRRKSKIIIGRAFKKLDKTAFLGDNFPVSVLAHFSKDGVYHESHTGIG